MFHDGDGGYGILMISRDDGVCEAMLYYDCVPSGCDVELIYCIWDLYNMKLRFRVISHIPTLLVSRFKTIVGYKPAKTERVFCFLTFKRPTSLTKQAWKA